MKARAPKRLAASKEAVPLTLADVVITQGRDERFSGTSLVPFLKLGGTYALTRRLAGLCDLMSEHDELGVDELKFVREWLRDLAGALFYGDDEFDGGATAKDARTWTITRKALPDAAPKRPS